MGFMQGRNSVGFMEWGHGFGVFRVAGYEFDGSGVRLVYGFDWFRVGYEFGGFRVGYAFRGGFCRVWIRGIPGRS